MLIMQLTLLPFMLWPQGTWQRSLSFSFKNYIGSCDLNAFLTFSFDSVFHKACISSFDASVYLHDHFQILCIPWRMTQLCSALRAVVLTEPAALLTSSWMQLLGTDLLSCKSPPSAELPPPWDLWTLSIQEHSPEEGKETRILAKDTNLPGPPKVLPSNKRTLGMDSLMSYYQDCS